MNDEEIIKTCESVVVSYLNQGNTSKWYAEVFEIQSDKTHNRLKEHLKGMMALFEKGIEIIERENKEE